MYLLYEMIRFLVNKLLVVLFLVEDFNEFFSCFIFLNNRWFLGRD